MIGRPVGLGEAVVLGRASVASEAVEDLRPVVEADGARDRAGLPQDAEAVVGAAAEHDRRGAGGEATGLQQAGHIGQATTGWCG